MNNFEQNMKNMYAEKGVEWLNSLPELICEKARYWNLSNLSPVENLSYNYVASGLCEGKPIILKIGIDIKGLKREVLALKAFAGYGAVTVIDHKEGALLLDRLLPGHSLGSYFPSNEQESIEIVSDIMKKLYQAPLPDKGLFPTIRDWLSALDRGKEIPIQYLHKARVLRDALLESEQELKLLHGDLHHYNCINNRGEWMVIDPKGVIGEIAYEAAAFIRNPIPELLRSLKVSDIVSQRINAFSQNLGVDKIRIQQWCFVQAVLGWVWGLEDGMDPTDSINLTEFFNERTTVPRAKI